MIGNTLKRLFFFQTTTKLKLVTYCVILFIIVVGFKADQLIIPGAYDIVQLDNIGNIYAVKKDILEKYSPAGKLLKTFNNKTLGNISSIDCTNPMRIIVYYKNYFQLLFLDNTLAQNGDILSLTGFNFFQPNLVALSSNNGIWIYDQLNFELIRVDENFQKIQQTGNLNQLLGYGITPNYLVESNNQVFLNNPLTGILMFDIFGTYYRTIPIKGLTTFQIVDNNIVYYANSELKYYNLKTIEQGTIKTFQDSSIVDVKVFKSVYIQQKAKNIEITTK